METVIGTTLLAVGYAAIGVAVVALALRLSAYTPPQTNQAAFLALGAALLWPALLTVMALTYLADGVLWVVTRR